MVSETQVDEAIPPAGLPLPSRFKTNALLKDIASKLNEMVSVKDFGATGDGSTDDAAAIQVALDTTRGVYIPAGHYRLGSSLRIDATSSKWGFRIIGEGGTTTRLIPQAGVDAIILTGSFLQMNMDGFSILGAADSGRGIYGGGSGGPLLYNTTIKNLIIDTGSHAIDIRNMFSTTFANVVVSSEIGHGFFLHGGNTVLLNRCYASQIRTQGKAGYRIATTATLLNCNGLDMGDYWGVFGGTTGHTDFDYTAYPDIVMIKGNVEDFRKIGLVFIKEHRANISDTTFRAPATGTFDTHIKFFGGNAASGFVTQLSALRFGTLGSTRNLSADITCELASPEITGINMTSNAYWHIGNGRIQRFNNIWPGGMQLPVLPTANPADGGGTLWVDAANGHVLKRST